VDELPWDWLAPEAIIPDAGTGLVPGERDSKYIPRMAARTISNHSMPVKNVTGNSGHK
jgi:hypothetical protein